MESIHLRAHAKINLTLDVVGKRPDGYHDVEMIMQSVNLWDEIILKEIDRGIELDSNMKNLPRGSKNIAWRAAELIRKEFGVSRGVNIYIKKNIPIAAGMGGGSADCAGVLLGLSRLWDLQIEDETLKALGKSLGADVPFCLTGGTALAQGIGDILTPITSRADIWLVIIRPNIWVSTKEIYGRLDLNTIGERPDNEAMIKHLGAGRISGIAENLVNVLEGVTIPMHLQIARIKSQLMEQGALGSLMSGTGPTVYGVFKNQFSARRAARVLRKKYRHTYVVNTVDRGIHIG
ncbi:MAG: 4-(cytidine 5'-diphospho)-2-C-methyl-D-erythritol kinase [Clostridiales bacterium]|jgi:4-diphosphocytidyl-2-C-methyl-D-erythritol kinase|nr:4-(cytidine 5'-diphospho)-2-C-methyl-D-erythritol kinase [Clostridiales bacterium]